MQKIKPKLLASASSMSASQGVVASSFTPPPPPNDPFHLIHFIMAALSLVIVAAGIVDISWLKGFAHVPESEVAFISVNAAIVVGPLARFLKLRR